MTRRTERGVEALLKKKKSARGLKSDGDPHTPADPPMEQEPPPEVPAGQSSPHEPPPRERPKIKTRETVTAREGSTLPSGGSRTESASAGLDRMKIKTRESAVQDVRVSSDGTEPVTTGEPERPQIRMRETAALPDHTPSASSGTKPSERLSIKTKSAYIQRQPPTASAQSPQALTQDKQEFTRERGWKAAAKRAKSRHTDSSAVPPSRGGWDSVYSTPPQHGQTSIHSNHGPVNPGKAAQDGGKTFVKSRSEQITSHTIKTAERSPRKAIKTTQRTAEITIQTAKTAVQDTKAVQRAAQAAERAAQQAVQASTGAKKSLATTAKGVKKAGAAALRATVRAARALAAALTAGGSVVVAVILLLCLVGLLVVSPFGIFFSDSGDPDAVSPSAAVAQINREYADTLSSLQAGGSYDSVEILGRPPSWVDVFAVFAVKTVSGDGVDVVILDADRVERLRTVFWDMTKITTAARTVDHSATEDAEAWTEIILTITVTPRTTDDMRVFYQFTDEQNTALDSLLMPESRDLWNQLLYGSSGEIVAVALSQVGNVGGQPYWSWYGFNSRVEWCACFVSWCANECGYIDAGVIPKFAGCSGGANWFKNQGLWQENTYEPSPGDLAFFDWDNKGSSGPQDGSPDHVGIVERVENGVVYTVEGNSGDSCRQRSYSVGHYEIWGYATPLYN